jgi:hypothetical protein
MSAPLDRMCVDCQRSPAILVTQERRVYARLCTWQICVECLVAYERVSGEIRREQEAKALGKVLGPVPKKQASTQRSLT